MEEQIIEKKAEEKIGKLSEKFKIWLKDPYNKIFLAILIFLIIFRFYWFFKVGNQPLWWDEADYMNMAKVYIGKGDYWKPNFFAADMIRPVLLPAISSLILFLGLGEQPIRLIILLASIISVPLIYGIGKQFFDKKTALFSAFILSVFWSFSFYSYRILVDVPVAMLVLAAVYFFFKAYFEDKNWKYFVIAGIFLGLSFLMKFSSIILVFAFAVYLLTTERLKIFKNKKVILFFLASFLTILPYFIYGYLVYKHPLAFFLGVAGTRAPTRTPLLQSAYIQVAYSIKLMHWVFIAFFYIGLVIAMIYLFLLLSRIIAKKSSSNKSYFIFVWLILSLLFFGYQVNDAGYTYLDERYYFVFYPVLFLLSGYGFSFVYNNIKKYNKTFALLVILALFALGAYQNIAHTNQIISVKKESYTQLKQAGEFIKSHTLPEDKIMILEETAEITYYCEREFVHIAHTNSTSIMEKIKEHKPKYAVLSFLFSITDEANFEIINFVFSNPDIFKPVQAYPPYIDKEQKIPLAAVFEINSEYY